MEPTFIAMVGDHDPDVVAHRAVPKSLGLAALSLGRPVDAVWVPTERVLEDEEDALGFVNAIWLVPASPYRSMEGALAAVRRARERGLPFLGTCGGFQHAVIEFARNVCGITDADHAETNPHASTLLVAPLACALREVAGRVQLAEGTKIREAYGREWIEEEYMCGYGLNPEFRGVLESHGMRFTGHDTEGDVRSMELADHPFFVGTLFQPERAALLAHTPPLVRAFVKAATGAYVPEPAVTAGWGA
ncbi:MAG TPA: CTP synthase [Longimicrobium sp.]|nr:CTP synthase [Longimicrobium sp.]